MDTSCPRACEAVAGPSAEAVAQCLRWAVAGECVANPAFMREQCAEQCTCEARAAQGDCGKLAATASELDLADFERRCMHALRLQECHEHAARAAELLQRQPTCAMKPVTTHGYFTHGILFNTGETFTVALLRKLLAEQELDVHTAFRTNITSQILVMLSDRDHSLSVIMPKLQRCVQVLEKMKA